MKKPRRSANARTPGRSLKSSRAFEAFVLDQLEGVGDVTARKMFGGVGLYARGLFFGIVARDALYLKVDSENRADFKAARSKPFRPYADRPGTMKYYEVPVGVLESAPDLVNWARRAIRAAGRSGRSPSSRASESDD
jgi:DNA transformation protein